jgi:5,10-methylenetetrahydromethanopterin reductase
MSTLSLLVPFMPTAPSDMLRHAALVGSVTGARLWQGQAVTIDPFHSFTYAAGAGHAVPVGLSVSLMPLKHPFQAALEARSLAQVTGHPVVHGLGPGPLLFQDLLGWRTPSQLTAVRDYVTAMRDLLAGRTTAPGAGVTSAMPLLPMESPQVRIGLGVLRPRMARLAGEVADVAVTWLAPADYVRDTIAPALAEGAACAQRDRPTISSVVPIALRRPGRNVYKTVLASNYGHLTGPHYQDMLARAGITVDADRPGPAAKAVLDGGAFLHDDVAGLRQRLAAFRAAGVEEVVLNLTGVHALEGPDAALEEAAELLVALAEPKPAAA